MKYGSWRAPSVLGSQQDQIAPEPRGKGVPVQVGICNSQPQKVFDTGGHGSGFWRNLHSKTDVQFETLAYVDIYHSGHYVYRLLKPRGEPVGSHRSKQKRVLPV